MFLDNPATVWVLIPLAAISIAPFKMWLRVLEQIVTDSGAQTASQIEALRGQDRIPMKDQTP